MVEDAYVNHVPVMTGGYGHDALRRFYAEDFIPLMPGDTTIKLVSRTLGEDQLVDEMIFSFAHTEEMPWMPPAFPHLIATSTFLLLWLWVFARASSRMNASTGIRRRCSSRSACLPTHRCRYSERRRRRNSLIHRCPDLCLRFGYKFCFHFVYWLFSQTQTSLWINIRLEIDIGPGQSKLFTTTAAAVCCENHERIVTGFTNPMQETFIVLRLRDFGFCFPPWTVHIVHRIAFDHLPLDCFLQCLINQRRRTNPTMNFDQCLYFNLTSASRTSSRNCLRIVSPTAKLAVGQPRITVRTAPPVAADSICSLVDVGRTGDICRFRQPSRRIAHP
jgi:hypothetical protein